MVRRKCTEEQTVAVLKDAEAVVCQDERAWMCSTWIFDHWTQTGDWTPTPCRHTRAVPSLCADHRVAWFLARSRRLG